jgi:hypothetical protein
VEVAVLESRPQATRREVQDEAVILWETEEALQGGSMRTGVSLALRQV